MLRFHFINGLENLHIQNKIQINLQINAYLELIQEKSGILMSNMYVSKFLMLLGVNSLCCCKVQSIYNISTLPETVLADFQMASYSIQWLA